MRLLLILALILGCAHSKPAPCPIRPAKACGEIKALAAAPAPTAPVVIKFHLEVTWESVQTVTDSVQTALKDGAREFILDIDSPGGSVYAGLGLIDALRHFETVDGARVTCRVAPGGMAASMAAILLESPACGKRHMGKGSALLFHEPAIGEFDGGKEGDFRRVADMLADMNHRMAILVAARLGITPATYEAWIHDRDRWVSADEALDINAVDTAE